MYEMFLKKTNRQLRRFWVRQKIYFQTYGITKPFLFFISILVILFLMYNQLFRNQNNLNTHTERQSEESDQHLKLFIAIGSAPKNFQLRRAVRNSWLQWISNHENVAYRFFTDAPPDSIKLPQIKEPREVWKTLGEEAHSMSDLVFQPLPSGYGDNEHNAYGRRALYQIHWVVQNYPSFDYFLRVDDDSFLCVNKLLYELKSAPKESFFWGRYWCKEGRNRADENFMLFSSDIVRLFADDRYMGKLIPFDQQVTFGWNVGYLSWVLNLTIFDDQNRIDAQQGPLTKYMHDKNKVNEQENGEFCNKFLYAHHVVPEAMSWTFKNTHAHLMYSIPKRTSPLETCNQGERSFVSARHSKQLPDLKIVRSLDIPG